MDDDIHVNKSYADNYNKWRGKEELQRCMYFKIVFNIER